MRHLIIAVLGFALIAMPVAAQQANSGGRSFGSGTCREKAQCSSFVTMTSDQLAAQAKACAWEVLGLNTTFDGSTMDSNNCLSLGNAPNGKAGLSVQCCIVPTTQNQSLCSFRCSLNSR